MSNKSGRTYILCEPMNGGGVGSLYKALDDKNQPVVIKIPKLDLRRYVRTRVFEKISSTSESFTAECQASKRFESNPRLVDDVSCVLDNGHYSETLELLNGEIVSTYLPFLVLRFIEGLSLDDWCNKQAQGTKFTGQNSATSWFGLCRNIVRVLAGVHSERVVHADIWPPNIMIRDGEDEKPQPVLIDFGKAWLSDALLFSEIKESKHAAYIAPETFGRVWDYQADIFSIGAVFYFLATGSKPPCPFVDPKSKLKILKNYNEFRIEVYESLKSQNDTLLAENEGVFEIIWYCLHPITDFRAPLALSVLDLMERFNRRLPETPSNSMIKIKSKLDFISHTLGIDKFGKKPLFLEMVQNSVHRLERNINCAGTRLFTIRGSRDEMLDGFLTCLAALQPGDTCDAVLTITFWTNANFGVGTQIVSMLRMLAKRRVTLRWLVLVSESEVKMLDTQQILNSLGTALANKPDLEFRVNQIDDETRRSFYRAPISGIYIEQKSHNLIYPTLITPYYSYRHKPFGTEVNRLRELAFNILPLLE